MRGAELRREIPRTFFHILGGMFLAALGLFLPDPLRRTVLGAIFVGVLGIDLMRLRSAAVGRIAARWLRSYMRPTEQSRLSGAPAFTAGVFLSFLLFAENVAAAALVPLVFGDRAGLLVGKAVGRMQLGGKTLEGSLACFAVSLLIYGALARLFPGWFDLTLPALVGAAAVGTLAEALPRPFEDNLVIPLAVGAFLTFNG